jgi:hypothetical protein
MADKKNNTWLESMFAGMTGLFSGFSQYLTGEATAEGLTSRALTNTFNARQARLDTAAAIEETERSRGRFIGAGNVARAKQGVATGGSASLVIDEADRQFAMDVLAMKHREELTQLDTHIQNLSLQNRAGAARRIGRIGAFGSLLTAGAGFSEAIRIGRD